MSEMIEYAEHTSSRLASNLPRREQRQLESSGLVKTTPVENKDYKSEFQLLSTSGSSFHLNDKGDLDFQSESRRVKLNASGS